MAQPVVGIIMGSDSDWDTVAPAAEVLAEHGRRAIAWDEVLETHLPDDVVVLPGHGEQTSIGRERATNPYLAQASGAPKGRGL